MSAEGIREPVCLSAALHAKGDLGTPVRQEITHSRDAQEGASWEQVDDFTQSSVQHAIRRQHLTWQRLTGGQGPGGASWWEKGKF